MQKTIPFSQQTTFNQYVANIFEKKKLLVHFVDSINDRKRKKVC